MDLTEFVYLDTGATVSHNGQTWTVARIDKRGYIVIVNDEDAKRVHHKEAEVENYHA